MTHQTKPKRRKAPKRRTAESLARFCSRTPTAPLEALTLADVADVIALPVRGVE